jgi:riboflavin synthase
MFTGIIEGVGTVRTVKKKGDGLEIEIACDFDLEQLNVGDSVSVNGCCLTVTSRLGKCFWTDVSKETYDVSTFNEIKQGDPVNLERARQLGSRLEGHIVQGHVDGIGKIVEIKEYSGFTELAIEAPENLNKYIVNKGSVAVDGVSLTVNRIENNKFFVMIIPHTKLKTTFSKLETGKRVNLEVDIIGKYVEKLAFLDSEEFRKDSKITEEFLKKHGF